MKKLVTICLFLIIMLFINNSNVLAVGTFKVKCPLHPDYYFVTVYTAIDGTSHSVAEHCESGNIHGSSGKENHTWGTCSCGASNAKRCTKCFYKNHTCSQSSSSAPTGVSINYPQYTNTTSVTIQVEVEDHSGKRNKDCKVSNMVNSK